MRQFLWKTAKREQTSLSSITGQGSTTTMFPGLQPGQTPREQFRGVKLLLQRGTRIKGAGIHALLARQLHVTLGGLVQQYSAVCRARRNRDSDEDFVVRRPNKRAKRRARAASEATTDSDAEANLEAEQENLDEDAVASDDTESSRRFRVRVSVVSTFKDGLSNIKVGKPAHECLWANSKPWSPVGMPPTDVTMVRPAVKLLLFACLALRPSKLACLLALNTTFLRSHCLGGEGKWDLKSRLP